MSEAEKNSYAGLPENGENGGLADTSIFENKKDRLQRKLSLLIINSVGFISTIGFSIVLTGAYPYLLQIDEEADKKFLGLALAANPVGNLISSPIIGWLANKFGTVRWLCMGTGVLNMIGFILYACLGGLPQPRRYWMIVARFIVGIAAGSATLCIMYISKATTTKERTTYISINALLAAIGFILGPVLQSSLIPLGQEGVHMGVGDLRWNMYTAAGWLSAALSLVFIILFMPGIFREFNMAEKEAEWNKMKLLNSADKNGERPAPPVEVRRDPVGLSLCITNFAVAGFILIMVESLATPMAMDQLGYTDEEAVKKVGIVLSIGCALTAISFGSSGPLAKKITERKALMFCGLIPLLISQIILLPFGGPTPPMQQPYSDHVMILEGESSFNASADSSSSAMALGLHNGHHNGTRGPGCPPVQEWCLYTSALHPVQLVLAFAIIAVGYAFTATMSTSTMTQLLGPKKQGTWNGIYQSGGSLSRVLGPLYLTNVYTNYGTWATFGSVIGLLAVVIAFNAYFFKRLIPLVRRTPKL